MGELIQSVFCGIIQGVKTIYRGEISLKPEISLSPAAIRQIEEILSVGKSAEIKIIREKRGKRLLIRETTAKTKYDLVISE